MNIALGRRNSIVRAIVRYLYRLTIKKAIVHILNTAIFLKNPHLRVLASFTHLVVILRYPFSLLFYLKAIFLILFQLYLKTITFYPNTLK